MKVSILAGVSDAVFVTRPYLTLDGTLNFELVKDFFGDVDAKVGLVDSGAGSISVSVDFR